MTDIVERIGKTSMDATATFRDILSFAFTILFRMFQKKTYSSAMKMVLVNQIYFTSVQILPLFIGISIIFGSLLIGIVLQIIKNLGLAEYLGRILMGVVVTELSPFVTVLLIALRSSSAINAEIAVMKVNKELRILDTFNIDVIDYLFYTEDYKWCCICCSPQRSFLHPGIGKWYVIFKIDFRDEF